MYFVERFFPYSFGSYAIKKSNVFWAWRTVVPISTDNKEQAKEELEQNRNKINFSNNLFTTKL